VLGFYELRKDFLTLDISIAMQGLNIATTEALTLVGSETEVYRENIETGATTTGVIVAASIRYKVIFTNDT
jgi:uncharacterized protein YdiU (UPF0061 family)